MPELRDMSLRVWLVCDLPRRLLFRWFSNLSISISARSWNGVISLVVIALSDMTDTLSDLPPNVHATKRQEHSS